MSLPTIRRRLRDPVVESIIHAYEEMEGSPGYVGAVYGWGLVQRTLEHKASPPGGPPPWTPE